MNCSKSITDKWTSSLLFSMGWWGDQFPCRKEEGSSNWLLENRVLFREIRPPFLWIGKPSWQVSMLLEALIIFIWCALNSAKCSCTVTNCSSMYIKQITHVESVFSVLPIKKLNICKKYFIYIQCNNISCNQSISPNAQHLLKIIFSNIRRWSVNLQLTGRIISWLNLASSFWRVNVHS